MDITKVEDIETEIVDIERIGVRDPEKAHIVEDVLLREYIHYRASKGDKLAKALEKLYRLDYPKYYA